MERLANYLRQNSKLQRCFQIMHNLWRQTALYPGGTVYS
jgi:hypothetical protein